MNIKAARIDFEVRAGSEREAWTEAYRVATRFFDCERDSVLLRWEWAEPHDPDDPAGAWGVHFQAYRT